MGKRLKTRFWAAGLGLFSTMALFGVAGLAHGQSASVKEGDSLILKSVQEEAVRLEDLGVENPGILQTNPFYFMKTFRRTTLRAFKLSAVLKAEFELIVLNEKAAELKRLEEIIPDNSEALIKASNAYLESLDQLQPLLMKIEGGSDDPEIDRLLWKLTDTGIKHIKLFDQLKLGNDIRTRVRLVFLQDRMSEVMVGALSKLDKPEKTRQRFTQVIENQRGGAFKEFRAAEALDRIQEKTNLGSPLNGNLLLLKEDLFLKTQGKIKLKSLESTLPVVMERLPGDFWVRVKVLDESREYLTDSGLRSDLGAVRQLILDLSANSKNIGRLDAEKILESASSTINFLRKELEKSDRQSKAAELFLAKAEFNLKQAGDAFASGQHVSSFGQGSAALAAGRSALNQIIHVNNLDGEVMDFKSLYDALIEESIRNGLNKEINPELFGLLSAAEASLIKAADLAAQKGKGDESLSELRAAKVNLFEARLILNDSLVQLKELERARRASQPLIQRVLQ
jgi:hypothetical protein